MGSEEFAEQVFTKVFMQDIERLRKLEDMWKARKPPNPLDFDSMQQQSSSVDTAISQEDQRVWRLEEDFVVFKDRFAFLISSL